MFPFKKSNLDFDEVWGLIDFFIDSSVVEITVTKHLSWFEFVLQKLKVAKKYSEVGYREILATRVGLFEPYKFESGRIYEAGYLLGVIRYYMLHASEEHYEYIKLPCRALIIGIEQQRVVLDNQKITTIKPV